MKRLLTLRQVEGVRERLEGNLQVRRTLSGNGRLHIDRQLPFLLVYRRPVRTADHCIDRIVMTTASYLIVDGGRQWMEGTAELIESVAGIMTGIFGDFLVMEVWASGEPADRPEGIPPRPAFTLHHRISSRLPETLDAAKEYLSKVKILKQTATVDRKTVTRCCPDGQSPLFGSLKMREMGISWLGLEVDPVYLDPESGDPFPIMVRSLSRQVGVALEKLFYSFSRECTTHRPKHYHMLGRRAMVKAVREVDHLFDEIGRSFDLLQLVTPINVEKEWSRFQRRRFQEPPRFLYRPSPVDPGHLKARLYNIRIDRIEDPVLMDLFLDKQRELDRQISLIMDRHRPSFLFGSLQLYGRISERTLATAHQVLDAVHARPCSSVPLVDARDIKRMAFNEIAEYRKIVTGFAGDACISDAVYAGLLVSQGQLLIGSGATVPENRADALIQHEIGTHVLTYSNGQSQPFKMLATGLPGYDGLQEGLAVLSEYLCGGLDAARLRLLAIRVIAVQSMVEGATFIDVFRLLNQEYGFSKRAAYMVTMRVFRGGGLTKDAIYLKGLIDVLGYLGEGNPLAPLFVGKFALKHLPVVEELLLRKVLAPPAVLPLYLQRSDAKARLKQTASGLQVTQLICS